MHKISYNQNAIIHIIIYHSLPHMSQLVHISSTSLQGLLICGINLCRSCWIMPSWNMMDSFGCKLSGSFGRDETSVISPLTGEEVFGSIVDCCHYRSPSCQLTGGVVSSCCVINQSVVSSNTDTAVCCDIIMQYHRILWASIWSNVGSLYYLTGNFWYRFNQMVNMYLPIATTSMCKLHVGVTTGVTFVPLVHFCTALGWLSLTHTESSCLELVDWLKTF